jgi:hypothetical protein
MKQCLTSWILLPIACILASMYLTVPSPGFSQPGAEPIIDMHLHACHCALRANRRPTLPYRIR